MHAISHHRADAELAHLARRVGNDLVLIIKQNREAAIGEDFLDKAFHRQQFFLGQA